MKKCNFDFWLKWISTGLLIAASILSSLNLYPFNVMLAFAGNVGWCWAGVRMKEPSLWVVSLSLLVVYLFGIFYSTTH